MMIKTLRGILITATVTLTAFPALAQKRTELIYNNNLVHTTLEATIENGKTTITYSVTDAAMWSGKTSSINIFEAEPSIMADFLKQAIDFTIKNKKTKATTTIYGIKTEIKRVAGIWVTSFHLGKTQKNSNLKTLQNSLNALNEFIEKNPPSALSKNL